MTWLDTLQTHLHTVFGEQARITCSHNEVTLEVSADKWVDTCTRLRDHELLHFETCIDLCGVDYSAWQAPTYQQAAQHYPQRFAVVIHLLSLKHNWRLRVRAFTDNNDYPSITSLCTVWPTVNWFEREAFDLYGIVFEDHPDLRRILTDYGFIGHPFRKDFPISGYVEMRYDPEQKRVIYQPVTIEPREITPRVVREDDYGVGR